MIIGSFQNKAFSYFVYSSLILNRGIFVDDIFLISISDSVCDGAIFEPDVLNTFLTKRI